MCSVTGCCGWYAVCSSCVSKLAAAPKSVAIKEDFSLSGISIDYMRWLHAEFGPLLGRITTSQFEKMYLRPRSALLRCSVADELAAHAATAHHVGPATWFISHTWSNAVADTLEAILNFFEGRSDSASAKLWMDVFVDSQHVTNGPSKDPSWYMSTFKTSIAHIGCLLLVVDVWDNPTALQRAWCVLELHAIAEKRASGGGDFAMAFTRMEKDRFVDIIRRDTGAYYRMLGTLNPEKSTCSRPDDRERIHASIRESVGFVTLSRMIFRVLEEWMERELCSQAAASVAACREEEEMSWNSALATILFDQGRYAEALVLRKTILEYRQRVMPDNHAEMSAAMTGVAAVFQVLGRQSDSLVMLEKVLGILQNKLPVDDPKLNISMSNVAAHYLDLGRYSEALVLGQRVLESQQRTLPEDHPNVCESMYILASIYNKLGRHSEALALQEKALDFMRRMLPEDHPDIHNRMTSLCSTYSALGRYSEALVLGQRVLESQQRTLPEDHPAIGTSVLNVGTLYANVERFSDALLLQEKALDFLRRVRPDDHPQIGHAYSLRQTRCVVN
jgi:tetratricopeptide (TPR) repeat protein